MTINTIFRVEGIPFQPSGADVRKMVYFLAFWDHVAIELVS
jgi:hypothetical protein